MRDVPVLAASLLVFVVGCSGSDSTPPTPVVNSAALDTACNNLATVICQKIAGCGAQALQRRYTDQPTCIARQKQTCTSAAEAPDTGRTVDSINACGSAYSSGNCSDILEANPPAVCQASAHPGKRALGAACTFAGQCASAVCNVPRGAACGTCVAAAPAAGTTCPTACATLQYCNLTTSVCTAYATLGQPCDATTTACGVGLGCVGIVNGNKGVCAMAATTVGAACDTSTATGTPCAAEEGLVCETKQCVKAATATTGGACGATKPTPTVCLGGSRCDNALGDAGTCQGPAADGAACSTADETSCMSGADCVGTATGQTFKARAPFASRAHASERFRASQRRLCFLIFG